MKSLDVLLTGEKIVFTNIRPSGRECARKPTKNGGGWSVMERRTILSNFLERRLLLSSVLLLKTKSRETPKGLSDTSTSLRRSANNSDIFFEQQLQTGRWSLVECPVCIKIAIESRTVNEGSRWTILLEASAANWTNLACNCYYELVSALPRNRDIEERVTLTSRMFFRDAIYDGRI